MLLDWRRQVLQLPSTGALTEQAVRAAYWRLIGAQRSGSVGLDVERIRAAKQGLLFELGLRLPSNRSHPKSSNLLREDSER